MTSTSQISFLAEPTGDQQISERTLGYVTEAAREEMFDMIATACVESGVQRSQIAKRLNKDPAQVTRQLSAPGNLTIDTIAEYMFAINGSLIRAASYCPKDEHVSNNRYASCLSDSAMDMTVIQITPRPRHSPRKRRPTTASAIWK